MLLMSGIEVDDQSLMLIGEVEDTGTGMSEEKVELLFDSPTEAHTRTKGLGLSLTKRLLEHMEGSITVNSQLDIGSRFIFSFMAGTTEQAEEQLLDTLPFEGKHVLLVIDKAKSRDVLEVTLRKWGHGDPLRGIGPGSLYVSQQSGKSM